MDESNWWAGRHLGHRSGCLNWRSLQLLGQSWCASMAGQSGPWTWSL